DDVRPDDSPPRPGGRAEPAALRLGAPVARAARGQVMARDTPMLGTPMRDTMLLFAGLVALWQLLSSLAGAEVLTSPLVTLDRLRSLMADPDFPAHAAETGSAFAVALAISPVGGLLLGVALGAPRLSGKVADPL